ncbi:hypothetical protein OCGS_1223 [Oceaniovalibus guishaninsula JLT2003]|uniref:FG-GAP repeat domain protein n=1 Tax=Oceaniovalibus guishaninsula JLT2003 TaxID=1231392 RepID=K2I5X0_9RHOB|nr:VCBS repeat-containing protein [Oceaniovalibus guishaninsula]EKE44385.1 hypothetical protein OCGS_1223 [Oceaniovalibus guishaninsula JLT2003]
MRLAAALLLALTAPAGADIADARYAGPTDRYPHDVLGGLPRHDTLTVTTAGGRRLSARRPDAIVFEDTAPRLADLDGDGAAEVVVVESHRDLGSRLAIWGLRDGQLTQLGATPFIGRRFRWLAPVGAADLDGDGTVELAYVDRPHLARTLRVWRWRDGALVPVAALPGVTNHRVGDRTILGGIRTCGASPQMIVASADWSRLLAVTLTDGALTARDIGPIGDAASAMACR